MLNIIQSTLRKLKLAGFIIKKIGRKIHKPSLKQIEGIVAEQDIKIPMRDGVSLAANIYKPLLSGNYPVLMCMTPYGKDEQPEHYELFKAVGINVGTISTSDYAVFEGPDPGYWVKEGYVMIHVNARGMWNSEGKAHIFDKQNGLDFYDLIEWAGVQSWSNGKVGLTGVSYLAWSQWMAAPLNPPHLTAICPWEGFTDMYRDVAYQGGIPETGLMSELYNRRFKSDHNKAYGLNENLLENAKIHYLDDDYWANKRPDLAKITVPALICLSWSDQGLHTRGVLEAYKNIRSDHKWLFTHGRRKWEVYYSDESKKLQKRFFDYFLKGENNGMLQVPAVRLEVRTAYYQAQIRYEETFPVKHTAYKKLLLNANEKCLSESGPLTEQMTRYNATDKKGKAVFDFRFIKETEITGGMKLRFWVSTDKGDDMDLFVAVKKMDTAGNEVYFSGYNGNNHDMVAKGWLRASQRALDTQKSTINQPWHTHQKSQKLKPGEIVPVEIEILPSSTLFETGTILRLEILGQEPIVYNSFKHEPIVNKGFHSIYTGGKYDAYLIVPLVLPVE